MRISLVFAVLLSGCCGPSPDRQALILEEIATIGSMAQMDGTRDAGQVRRIQEDVEKTLGHVRESWK